MAAITNPTLQKLDDATYRKRIRAWTLYDWANSAFATTILAAMLPAYYSSVAGSTLPSESTATAYWSLTLSVSLLIIAILSPILGTISDIKRGKKRFLAIFIGIGVIATGALVFVSTGDWVLASIAFILGRIGFGGANVFYDALLPHIAKKEDQDRVSTRGYAMGYLGGGLLLAINVAMFLFIPDSWFEFAGTRLSFLSVAIWWAVFSIPILRQVPEPPAATEEIASGESTLAHSIRRLRQTFGDMRQYGELFKYLVSFLIYNDAIGTIIGVAVIYGAELGFGTLELVLALLLVQFVGIPFSLIFGNLPNDQNQRRNLFLAYIIFNLVALPLVGILGRNFLPEDISGVPPAPYQSTEAFIGEGDYSVVDDRLSTDGTWDENLVTGDVLAGEGFLAGLTTTLSGQPDDVTYLTSSNAGDTIEIPFNGQEVELTYSVGPENGIWDVLIDNIPVTESTTDDAGNTVEESLRINTYNPTIRYGDKLVITANEPGEHTLSLVNSGESDPASGGTTTSLASVSILQPQRQSSLPTIIGILVAIQIVGLIFAYIFQNAFAGLAKQLDTRRTILLALLVYCVIAIWGFFLEATIEFWLLAFMVAVVQGGSQALSRSLYASMTPSAKSGEFFGLFSIMEKFASIIGPLLFALAVATFGNSRPAILSLIALFVIGGYLLTRVDIEKGQQKAAEEDRAIYGLGEA